MTMSRSTIDYTVPASRSLYATSLASIVLFLVVVSIPGGGKANAFAALDALAEQRGEARGADGRHLTLTRRQFALIQALVRGPVFPDDLSEETP